MPETIKQFDKANLKAMRGKIQAALNDVLKEFGVAAELGNITFGAADARTKLTLTIPGSAALPAKQDEWNLHCRRYGLLPEHFGRTFRHKTLEYTIQGIFPRSTKAPVLAVNSNGTAYKFPVSIIRTALMPDAPGLTRVAPQAA